MNITLQSIIDADNEARVLDTDLAEWLGYERDYKIRELIARNKGDLEVYGPLPLRWGQSRGQHYTAYLLNEGQALLLCALSRTPKAAEVRHALITVFMAWRHSKLPPVPADHPERTVHVVAHRRAPKGWHQAQEARTAADERVFQARKAAIMACLEYGSLTKSAASMADLGMFIVSTAELYA